MSISREGYQIDLGSDHVFIRHIGTGFHDEIELLDMVEPEIAIDEWIENFERWMYG